MNSIRAIQKLNKRELEEGINPEGSWHTDYRDTAFINVGGLPFELSEGDIITLFSQYGEPVWIKLARDKETGKSRGFAWLKYEDQRSCDLAVDNLGGATVMDRVLRVDHARYKPKDDEDMRDNTMGEPEDDPGDGSDGGRRKRRRTESESDSDDDRPLLPEEVELEKAIANLDEEDPMKEAMVKRLQEKADTAVKKYKNSRRKEKERERKHERRHRRDGSRHRDRSRDRRKIKDREESGDEHRHRSSRRRRDDPREKARDGHRDRDRRDRDRRDRSRERRHRSSDEEDRRHSRSKRSPRPSKDDRGRRDDDDRKKARPERDAR
ncbi:RNA-binding domain-containing protein [Lentithecium fluviatile CBS 122367]|uniref:RNA-binding domain-containing protein n=1 Tax=Lentithecium fluviatile CBS 122367 TaxID=1168545 RepID=A0A6G1IQM9_9PLEO|nr:RNA-binding domain-containing protein [Lentithecium fluviatile CBS 122367]